MKNLKKHILQIVFMTSILLPSNIYSQVRPDIYSFTKAQRTELGNLIIDFIDPDIIRMHCDYTTIMSNANYDIHDDFNFLPFHRAYIEKLEDWLLQNGFPQYVPLPKWTGLVAPPIEFSTVGGTGNPPGNGVSPDCGTVLSCANAPNIDALGNIPGTTTPSKACDPPSNWTGTVSMPT